jgi:hypothetical protein
MEDEDYFSFNDDVMIPTGERVNFGDAGTSIRYDGAHLTIVDDTNLWLDSPIVEFGQNLHADTTVRFMGDHNDAEVIWHEDENYFTFDKPLRRTLGDNARYYHIPLGSANPGASGPTWVPAGANTTGGWRLDAATEILRGQVDVHADWDGVTNPTFEVHFMTNVDNSGGADTDHVDISLTFYYKGPGDTATKTQTVEVPTVIGKAPQYKQFEVQFPLDWDLAGNVLEVEDILAVNLHLETDTSHVDDIVVVAMEFFYPTTHMSIELGDT